MDNGTNEQNRTGNGVPLPEFYTRRVCDYAAPKTTRKEDVGALLIGIVEAAGSVMMTLKDMAHDVRIFLHWLRGKR